MTAVAFQSECQTPWSSTTGSEILQDRFWAALNFAIDDGEPDEQRDVFLPKTIEPKLPLALVSTKPASPLQIDFGHDYAPVRARAETPRPAQHRDRKNSSSLRLKVPPTRPFVSFTLSPTTALPRSPISPAVNRNLWRLPTPISPAMPRNQWHLPTPGVVKPSTPALELVSNFLDSMVRLSESRSATPQAAVTVDGDGDILIVESEVLIQLVEDINGSVCGSPVEVHREGNQVKLQIPPRSFAVPDGSSYCIPSAVIADYPAGCAQELDALLGMSWDRQLSSVQHSLWR